MGSTQEHRRGATSLPIMQKPLLEQAAQIQTQGAVILIFFEFGGEAGSRTHGAYTPSESFADSLLPPALGLPR